MKKLTKDEFLSRLKKAEPKKLEQRKQFKYSINGGGCWRC